MSESYENGTEHEVAKSDDVVRDGVDEGIRKSIKRLCAEAISVHRKVASAIRDMSVCRYERVDPDKKI